MGIDPISMSGISYDTAYSDGVRAETFVAPTASDNHENDAISDPASTNRNVGDSSGFVSGQNAIKNWQKQLSQPNIKVEFASNEPMNRVWINIIDNNTGQVVYKFPPEVIRILSSHAQTNGLVTDTRV